MLKYILYLPILLCLDLKPNFNALLDMPAAITISFCDKKDIKHGVNLDSLSFNLATIEL